MKSLERSYETLLLEEVRPGVVVVTLNRPDRYNAMTNTMFAELERMALDLGAEDDCRVLVLTGAGRSFCAGYDLAEAEHLSSLGAIGMLNQQERAARALLAVRSTRMPVIAAVNGPAAGGGLAPALQADIRLGSPEAKFNAAFVRIGLSAGDLGTSWLLTRLVGPAVTSDIASTRRSCPRRARTRGSRTAPRMAPAPTLPSIRPKKPGPPPISWRDTIGRRAQSALATVKYRTARQRTRWSSWLARA